MKYMIIFLSLINANLHADTLLQTYQKEIAFLIAQKRTLQKQIKNQNGKYKTKIKTATKKVKKLQDQLVMLTADNERLLNKLSDGERSLENSQSNESLVNTTLSQAEVSLGLTLGEMGEETKLNTIFDTAFMKLNAGAGRTTQQDSFFLKNGKKVIGDITKIGNIARFGKYDDQTFMLMPVGAGRFKEVVTKDSISLNDSVLSAFLYESADKGIEIKKEQSFMEMVDAGGAIAYVIVALGILAMVLMLFRGGMLYLAGKVDDGLILEIEAGKFTGLNNLLNNPKTPFTRVIKNTYDVIDRPLDERENIIQESILGELNFLDRFGAAILVMAAVAPLLGLLGTVTGMISTFDIITEFGTGDPKLLSSGISEALITTKLGLIVAIPTLLVGNLFSGWSNKIKIMLEREALRLSNLASKFGPEVVDA